MAYFDHAATTSLDAELLEIYTQLLRQQIANPSSIHHAGYQAKKLLEKARVDLLKLLGGPNYKIIFTSGATEANNLFIKGAAFCYQNRGKHLITSRGEHPSVLNAFKQLESEFGFEVTYLPLTETGTISVLDLQAALRKDTILVALIHTNNETGAITDLNIVRETLKAYPKVLLYSDITQSLGKVDIPFHVLDGYGFSAHKIHGLPGSGALIVKKTLKLLPLFSGGGQEDGLRSGTSRVAQEVVLAATVARALKQQQAQYSNAISLNKRLRNQLEKFSDVQINSPENGSPFILNFSLKALKASVVVEDASNHRLMISSTAACSDAKHTGSEVVKSMFDDQKRAQNTIRLSFDLENSEADIIELETYLNDLLTKGSV